MQYFQRARARARVKFSTSGIFTESLSHTFSFDEHVTA